jgi:predicted ABC-type ATPase
MLTESMYDKCKFKAIFMAGSPGAGKTYTIHQIKDGTVPVKIVSTDHYTEFLVPSGDPDLQKIFIDKAMHLNKTQLMLYINSMLPLFVDSTSNNFANMVTRAGILESFGYDVGMIFVNTSLETCLERAKERVRHVDEDYIKEAYDKAFENLEMYKSRFSNSFFTEVKNDEGEFNDKAIEHIFKQTTKFFNSPLVNPEGKRTLEKLEESGGKYLYDVFDKDFISKKVGHVWYG